MGAKIVDATIVYVVTGGSLVMGYVSTLMRIQSTFEQAGIRLLDNDEGNGIGVHLAAPST